MELVNKRHELHAPSRISAATSQLPARVGVKNQVIEGEVVRLTCRWILAWAYRNAGLVFPNREEAGLCLRHQCFSPLRQCGGIERSLSGFDLSVKLGIQQMINLRPES